MKPNKYILIAGGVALAGGAIWYIKKKEKTAAEAATPPTLEPAIVGPHSEFTFPASGGAGFGGGGAPSSPTTGVTTAPPEEHNRPLPGELPGPGGCPPGTQAVGISAIAGQQGGVRCLPQNQTPEITCPTGSHRVCNLDAIAGHSACHCVPNQ
jgi:hypothetical protein